MASWWSWSMKCDACATPHHAERWDYFGGCSTYACARRGGPARPA